MRRIPLIALVVTLLPALCAAQVDAAKLLQRLPDDHALVLVVPSLERLAGGLNAYGKAGKISFLEGIDAEKLMENLNFPYPIEGMDLAGPMIISGTPDDDSPAVLFVLKDAAAWKKAAAAEDAGDGLLRVKGDEEGFASIQDNLAIVAASKEQLAALRKGGGNEARFAELKAADKALISVWVDVPKWKDQIQAALESFAMLAQMGAASAGPDAQTGIAMIRMFTDKVGELVKQTERFTLSARFDGDQAHVKLSAAFVRDAAVSRYLADVERIDANLLRGLPRRPMVMAGAGEWKTKGQQSLLMDISRDVINAISTETTPEDRKKVDEALDSFKTVSTSMTGFNFAMTVEDGHLAFMGNYLSRSPAELYRAMVDYTLKAGPLFAQISGMKDMKFNSSEGKIGATDALISTFEISGPQQKVTEAAYGKDLVFVAVQDQEGVAFAMASDPAARKIVGEMAQKGGEPDPRPEVERALAGVTKNPYGLLLIDVGESVRAAAAMAKAMNTPMPPVKAPSGAIVPMGLYLDKSAIHVEIGVSAAVARAIGEMGDQAPPDGAVEE